MGTLFISVLNMSLTASYVIAAIILARLFLKKAPKVISYILWAVAGFRLIFPFSFESMFSLIPFKSQPIPQTAGLVENVSFGSAAGAALRAVGDAANGGLGTVTVYLGKTADGYPVTTEAYHSEVWLMFGSYLWLIGFASLLGYSIISIILLKRSLRTAVLIEGNIYEAQNLKTPFVLGFLHPNIYIPSGLSTEEKSYIILHEQTHIRSFDHLVKLASYLVLCVHWFNPLVWVAFLLMSVDMEMSCDERVLKEMDSDIKKAYSTSLLSLATGQSIINSSPLAFGEGNIKSRITNVLSFKKPATWVIVVSVVFITFLSAGFAVNRATPDNSSDWDIYDFPNNLYDQATFTTEAEVYPPDFEAINAKLTNMGMHGVIMLGKKFTLVKKIGDHWRIVPLASGGVFTLEGLYLDVGEDYTYTIIPDMLAGNLDTGNYRIITDIWHANDQSQTARTVWADFTIAHPDTTGWQYVRISMLRDEVHKIMGEPVGMLSGLFGDIYRLDNGTGIIFYYDSNTSVYHIKLTEPLTDPPSSSASGSPIDDWKTTNEALELVADVDLDRDGREEYIYLDRSQMEVNFDITLRILDGSGNEVWSESANTAHAGWNSLFLYEQNGEYYLLRYNPTMYQGYCTYTYTLFTLKGGKETVIQSNTLEFDINGTKELDVPKMVSFSEEVNALLGKSILLMSTDGGAYSFGPTSAEPFFERYSWLDILPKLYSEGDNLETRLIKYSQYATSNR